MVGTALFSINSTLNSIPFVVMENHDSYGVTAVSGFYEPGALLSWVLVLLSYLLDRIFDAEQPHYELGARLPFDEDIVLGEVANEEEHARLLEDVQEEFADKSKWPLKLRLDLSLVSTCVYPLVAAGNLLYYTPMTLHGDIEQRKVARISAPLLVLRLYRFFGLLLTHCGG